MTATTEPAASTVGIVVVNYGSHELLELNLSPLSNAIGRRVVVVVDNPTNDDERQRVIGLARDLDWRTVLPETNTGFGGGMNLGVAEAIDAGATWLILINPDATMLPAEVERLRRHVESDPWCLNAPAISRPDGTMWSVGSDLLLDSGQMRSRRRRRPGDRFEAWLSGACLALSVELWREVGGFDDRYFLYWEDVDLSRRVVDAGGRLAVRDDVSAVHDEGATHRDPRSPSRAKSSTYYYYNNRNRLLYADAHLSAADRRRWRRRVVSSAWELLMQGGRRQLLRPRHAVGAVIAGLWDGFRGRSGPRRSSRGGARSRR